MSVNQCISSTTRLAAVTTTAVHADTAATFNHRRANHAHSTTSHTQGAIAMPKTHNVAAVIADHVLAADLVEIEADAYDVQSDGAEVTRARLAAASWTG